MESQMIPAWVDGTLTPVEKMQVHRLGLKHKAVSVFVMHDDQILIQQRSLTKYHTPGQWANTCCTHPLWDEADADCAARRLDEELGITDLHLAYRGDIEYRADVGGGLIEHEVVAIFVSQASLHLSIKPNPAEVMATRWIDIRTLRKEVADQPNAYTPWLNIYLQQHGAAIFGDTTK